MAPALPTFHWADYLVFSLMLVLSAGVGLFYAYKARKELNRTTEHLLTGNQNLKVFPVTLSLLATFLSAIFVLGIPTEIYAFGGSYWISIFSYVPTVFFVSVFFVPIFHKLRNISAYEYLETRFNKSVRMVGSLTFVVEMVIYLGVGVYTPALALSQVTGISIHVSILTIGLVCTFYTSIGGIKAVVWTDVIQISIVVTGMLLLMFQGAVAVGGWGEVFNRVKKGGRMPYFDFDPDPFVRHTFWTLTVGGFFTFLSVYGSNQATLQRYVNVKTHKGAQIVIWLNLFLGTGTLSVVSLTGLVIYAYYTDCDPWLSGRIDRLDQIVPLFMMEILYFAPGLPGLFVSCIFSAVLSTVSSGINSLAAVTLCDFVVPAIRTCSRRKLSAKTFSYIPVTIAIVYGLLVIGIAYLGEVVGKTVLQIGLSIFGILGGPILGLFVCGIFFPFINSWGAGAGWLCSLAVTLWVGVGAIANPISRTLLPLVTTGCTGNVTVMVVSNISTTPNTAIHTTESGALQDWYSLSYLHYGTLSVITAVVVASIVSVITGCNKSRSLDPNTYFDIRRCFREEVKIDTYYLPGRENECVSPSTVSTENIHRASTSTTCDSDITVERF